MTRGGWPRVETSASSAGSTSSPATSRSTGSRPAAAAAPTRSSPSHANRPRRWRCARDWSRRSSFSFALSRDVITPRKRRAVMDRRGFLLGAAAALATAPRAAARMLGGVPVALVTADLESRIVAVDLTDGRVHRRVPTLPYPRSIEAVGEHAIVTHPEIGAVSVVDARTLRVRHVIHGFGEPRYTAGHRDGRHAFVTDAARGEVVAIDIVRGRIVHRTPVGWAARHVSLAPDGRTLWVALGAKAREVAVVDVRDPTRPRVTGRFAPPFLGHDVAFAPDGRHAWVSSGDRNELAV